MLATIADVVLGLVLLGSAGAKLAAPARTRAALVTFGLRTERDRALAWGGAVAAEGLLGIGVAVGLDSAAWVSAVLMLGFAGLLARALHAGRAGQPCGCLGARSRVSAAALARTLLLAAAFALLPLVPDTDPTTDAWLAIGLGIALAAIAGLAILLLALAREVGELRLALPPQLALEIEGEGPARGSRAAVIDRFVPQPSARFAVAVFSSDGCPMCQALAPAVTALQRDPLLAVEVFDEHDDADVWRTLAIPGSPHALVLALDGTVLAQGTFNSARQLEALVATGEARERASSMADNERRRISDALAGDTDRRGFLARTSGWLIAAATGSAALAVGTEDADAYHYCGHTYTTASCPHPTGIPRVDIHGYPLRARDGKPVDDLGRPVDRQGRPLDEHDRRLTGPDGSPLPPAPRTRVCQDGIPERYGFPTRVNGSWYRCCGGRVRRLMDCCAHHETRIQGDTALTGYCYQGRRVFCVMYFQTSVPC